jgi:hypothetical protein
VLLQHFAPLGDLQRVDRACARAAALQLLGEEALDPVQPRLNSAESAADAPAISSATAPAKARNADRRGSSTRE